MEEEKEEKQTEQVKTEEVKETNESVPADYEQKILDLLKENEELKSKLQTSEQKKAELFKLVIGFGANPDNDVKKAPKKEHLKKLF